MDFAEICAIRDRYLKCYSPDIYDVLDKLGHGDDCCVDIRVKPISDHMKICGPAFTMYGTQEPGGTSPKFEGYAHYNQIYKGCVVVINCEKESSIGHWGEMMSLGARNAGATGVLLDGGTRDKATLKDLTDFAIFARYISPIESVKRWSFKDLQVPIYISGAISPQVLVRPGDWVFGDMDGTVVIPQEILMDVLEQVEELTEREILSREALLAGEDLQSVCAKYNRA